MKQIIEAITRMQKGHWGLVEPAFRVSIQAEFIGQARRAFRGHMLEIDCSGLFIAPSKVGEAIMSTVTAAIQSAKESGKKAVCCILHGFHHLDVEGQIASFSATRSIRESSSDVSLITVAIGSWNRYRIPELWKRFHPTSPCPDQKCIRTIAPYTIAELQARLLSDSWISSPPSELEDVTMEALLEFTGGDAFLIEEVLSTLRMAGRPLRDFPTTLDDVTTSETVTGSIVNRLDRIGEQAKSMLCSIIRQQRQLVNPRQVEIEDLRLAGLIRIERTGDIDLALPNSVLMEKVLRWNHKLLGGESSQIEKSVDFVSPSYAINCFAYHQVLQIESILRNAMVQYFYVVGQEGWRHYVKDIKTPGNPAELHSNEIHELGKKLIAALYPDFDISTLGDGSKHNEEGLPPEEKQKKPKMPSVVESALEWQGRSARQSWVRAAEDSLPQFMTTGALMNVYLGKGGCESLMKACFNDRDQAKTFFTRFLSLRSAVAHNHSLGVSALEDLISLKRELCLRLGQCRE